LCERHLPSACPLQFVFLGQWFKQATPTVFRIFTYPQYMIIFLYRSKLRNYFGLKMSLSNLRTNRQPTLRNEVDSQSVSLKVTREILRQAFVMLVKLKVKVKLSLCLTKNHTMKTYWGVEVELHAFLTSALDGDEWSTSRPGRFTPRERAPRTHWIGCWVGPRSVLDTVVKRKILSPRRQSKPRTPLVQPVAEGYTDWAITVKWKSKY
jgi:hypothetical protein